LAADAVLGIDSSFVDFRYKGRNSTDAVRIVNPLSRLTWRLGEARICPWLEERHPSPGLSRPSRASGSNDKGRESTTVRLRIDPLNQRTLVGTPPSVAAPCTVHRHGGRRSSPEQKAGSWVGE